MNTNVPMTTTVGYFNGNKYPIHLFISALNATIRLEVGQYIEDRAGVKINDSFFDQYAMHPNQLTKEVSDTPVPLNALPPFTQSPALPPGQPPVREITEFTKADRRGLHQPVIPPPVMQKPRDPSTTSIQAMSVDEARKRGLIRPTRPVPEDYGADETTGQPPSGERIPSIKYATDVPGTTKKPGAVVAPKPRMNIFQRKAVPAPAPKPQPPAVTPAPVVPASSIFGNRVVESVMAEAAANAAASVPTPPSAAPAPSAPVVPVEPATARKRLLVPRKQVPKAPIPATAVPPPPVPGAEPEAELPAPPEPEPQPEPAPAPATSATATPGWLAAAPEPPVGEAISRKFICLADAKPFDTFAELEEYVRANFPKQAQQLLEEYPEASR